MGDVDTKCNFASAACTSSRQGAERWRLNSLGYNKKRGGGCKREAKTRVSEHASYVTEIFSVSTTRPQGRLACIGRRQIEKNTAVAAWVVRKGGRGAVRTTSVKVPVNKTRPGLTAVISWPGLTLGVYCSAGIFTFNDLSTVGEETSYLHRGARGQGRQGGKGGWRRARIEGRERNKGGRGRRIEERENERGNEKISAWASSSLVQDPRVTQHPRLQHLCGA